MKKVLFLLVFIFNPILVFAQTEGTFTAFEGSSFAKAKANAMKLGQITMFAISNTTEFGSNSFIDGKCYYWRYFFLFNDGKSVADITMSKESGIITVKKTLIYKKDSLYYSNFKLFELQEYKDIQAGLLDSDAEFSRPETSEKSKLKSDLDKVYMTLAYGLHGNSNTFNKFAWHVLVIDTISYYPGFPYQEAPSEYLFSAENGEVLDYRYYTGVNEPELIRKMETPIVAGDVFNTELIDGLGTIEIFSANGVRVLQSEHAETIYVGNLTPGLYFLKFKNNLIRFIKL